MKASGLTTIMLLLTILLAALIMYSTYLTQVQHERMIASLNDLFIAHVLADQHQKQELPPFIKQKLEEKVQKRAEKLATKPLEDKVP